MNYTLIIEPAEEGGFVGYVPEIPGVHTQGETEEEVRENIVEAIQLLQEVRKEDALKSLEGNANYIMGSITI